MSDNELCYMTADEAISAFKAKTLSPVELVDAVIDQSEKVNDTVNAFTYTFFDEARAQAQLAEKNYANGEKTGDLEGLPIGIKDESGIKGQPLSKGSLIYKDYIAEDTSPVNQRVLDAGGIVHARTATPEFSCAGFTWSRQWGVTRNPWNNDFTSGGSSGGSSASLASGTSTICTGSDIGGSIRIPASTCGLVGYKPPYGRNPEEAVFNLDFYCHTGPLSRSVKDTIRLQNVMCGPSPKDIATLRPKLVLPYEYQPIKDWKIAYSPNLGCFEVDPEVEKNTLASLEVFKSLGATIEEVDLGWGPEVLEAGLAYLGHIFGAAMQDELEQHADELTSYARAFAEESLNSTPRDFLGSLDVAYQMYSTLGPILEEYNVLICPTTAIPAVPADFDPTKDELKINGKDVNKMLGWCMTTPFNTMSRCPVLTVPSGQASNGVPTGIQIVGRTYCDEDVFQAALAYETALGGWFNTNDKRPNL
jgi:Asp-tRNA(Asn)/Glu-tRNA(Gln) amidotransferase A subunit family amidase|tara:strand:- start:935 stop:2362 length:1428 start_codon:yes stop_codon:yes gene_type:complete